MKEEIGLGVDVYTDMEITGFCKQQQNQQKAENSMSTKPIENHR